MNLFDDVPRTRTGALEPGEPVAVWLLEFGGEEAERSRMHLERWFERFPDSDRTEVKARLLSGDQSGYRSALSELYLAWVFSEADFEIDAHPEVPGTTRRTDFLLTRKADRSFVEVRSLSRGAGAAAEAARLATIKKELNKVHTTDFFLLMNWELLERVPPMSDVRRRVTEWLATLDAESVDPDDLPTLVIESEGVLFDIAALPKPRETRGDRAEDIVAMVMEPVRIVPGKERIRRALREKSGRYGKPGAPFLIALVSEDLAVHVEDALDALYGSSVADFWLDEAGTVRSEERRRRDGFFGVSPSGPKNTRVSAILFVRRLTPWAPELAESYLFHNPLAEYPLVGRFLAVREFAVTEQREDHLRMSWAETER